MTRDPAQPDPQPDMVEFHRAKSPFDARVVVAVLEDAGIPAFVPGGLLADEFAMSQRLMNANAVAVFVPADRVDDAREALATAKRDADDAFSGDFEVMGTRGPDESPARPAPTGGRDLFVKLALGALAMLFAFQWLESRAEASALRGGGASFSVESDGERTTFTRRDTGQTWQILVDRNQDGAPEHFDQYGRDGALHSRSIDADSDGVYERTEWFDKSGRQRQFTEDANGDSDAELVWQRVGDLGLTLRDLDGDGFLERIEIRRGDTLLCTQVFRADAGYVTIE